jgi:predicted phage tail protein
MEKYNLNEGNDALKRVLLMMKYDAKKTLTENIEEMESVNEDTADVAIGSTAVGAGLGAATMGAAAAANVATTTALGSAAYSAAGVGTALGATSVTGAAALGGAVITGGAALLVLPLVYWLMTKDTGANKVKKMFEMCSTDAAKIAKLPRKLGETDLRSITDDIDDAINEKTWGFMAGTDEEKLFGAFKKLESGTASDFCALIKYYNAHSDSGDLFDDLDSDIDAEEEWKQIYRPIRNCVEDSLKQIGEETLEDCKANPNQAKCKGGGGGGGTKPKFRDCTGTYTQGCKSEVIRKVQGCLNIKPDGLFGPKTQGALESKGYKTGFTDADVDKLCPANVVVEPPVSQEDEYGYSDNSGDTPFDSTVGYISGDDASLDTLK